MYLTRIELDTTNRKTLKAFSSLSLFHGAIESCFIGEKKRKLWRLDHLNGKDYLMLLSENKPNADYIAEQFSGSPDAWQMKSYDSLLNRIEPGSVWRFKLRANPTYAAPSKTGRGRLCAYGTVDGQKKWLKKQAEKNGFTVHDNTFDVTEQEWHSFKKNDTTGYVKMLGVVYEGVLKVTDAEAFKTALMSGIGREKAYGMGLMTCVRA